MRALYAIALALSACGQVAPSGHDPLLAPYAEEFERLALERGLGVKASTMVLSGLDGKKGVCIRSGSKRWIEIDSNYFDRATPDAILILVLHEQGHCVLDRAHEDFGIMQAILPSTVTMDEVDELFDTVQK